MDEKSRLNRRAGFGGCHLIEVQIGGHKRSFEPLITGDGKVIVQGDNFIWTDADPTLVAGYQLEARSLPL